MKFEILQSTNFDSGKEISYKLLNIILENYYVEKYKKEGLVVCNKKHTISRIESNLILCDLFEEFKNKNITQYDDIFERYRYKISWKRFKEIFYL